MKLCLKLDGRTASGGSPMIMHSERLADPLDSFVEAIAAISKKRNKTKADHEELARLEFLGGMYCTPSLTYPLNGTASAKPCIPSWNVLRCLQDGAKRFKRGVDVPRGVYPLTEVVELVYDGPENPEDLWRAGTFSLRKSVGVQRSRMMRTRPIFTDWQAELMVDVDAEIFDVHTLRNVWKSAGVYSGLGDMRPIYGRFAATIEEL